MSAMFCRLKNTSLQLIVFFSCYSIFAFPQVIFANTLINVKEEYPTKKVTEKANNFLCPFNFDLPKPFLNLNESKKARRISDQHKVRGYELYKQGKSEAALEEYEKAIKIDPNNADAYNALGNLLREQLNDTDRAIKEYCKAITLNPKSHLPYNGLGNATTDKGEYNRAIAAFNKAIEINPNYAHAHNNLSLVLWSQNKRDDAIKKIRQGLKLPEQKGGRIGSSHALMHANLGRVLESQGKLEEAIEEYKKALIRNPQDEGIQVFLQGAESWLELQKYPERFNVGASQCMPKKKEPSTDILRSVVQVIARFPGGGRNSREQGTGWVLKKPEINKTWILTNRHVVIDDLGRKSKKIQIVLYNEPSISLYCPRYEAEVIYSSTNNEPDLALLEVTNMPDDIQPLKIFKGKITPNTPVQIIANPLNVKKWGIVNGKIRNLVKNTLEIQAPVSKGNSGGPLINTQKRVVGIINSKHTTKESFGFAHNMDIIIKQLRIWGIKL